MELLYIYIIGYLLTFACYHLCDHILNQEKITFKWLVSAVLINTMYWLAFYLINCCTIYNNTGVWSFNHFGF